MKENQRKPAFGVLWNVEVEIDTLRHTGKSPDNYLEEWSNAMQYSRKTLADASAELLHATYYLEELKSAASTEFNKDYLEKLERRMDAALRLVETKLCVRRNANE